MSDTDISKPELDEATVLPQWFNALATKRNDAAAAARNRDIIATKQAPRASSKRSSTGCITCRKRRKLCGMERPECSNCIKTNYTCEGYARPRTFPSPADAGTAQKPRNVAKIESPSAPIQPPSSSDDPRFYTHPWAREDYTYWDLLTNFPPFVPETPYDWARAKIAVRSEIHPTKSPSPTGSRKYRSSSESEVSFVHEHELGWRSEEELDGTTQKFAEDLAERLVQRHSLAAKAVTERPSDPSQVKPASSASGSGSTLRAKQATSIPTSRKWSSRSLEDGDDPDDNDDDDRRATDPKRQRDGAEQSTKLFACPYAKFNPERYSEQNVEERSYRGCASKYLRNIPRVKQHLYRVHARPRWYCGNCYEQFKTREQLNSHHRMRPPCEAASLKYEEMMTDDQYNRIKRRTAGEVPRDTWYLIFNILFPEAAPPLSPYVSTSNPDTLQHFVNFFHAYGPFEMMDLLRESHVRNGAPITLNASTQTVVDEAFEIAISESLRETTQAPESLLTVLAETMDRSAEAATGMNAAVMSSHSPLLSPSPGDSWEMVVNPEVTSEALAMLPVSSGPVSDPDLFSLQPDNRHAVDLDIQDAFDMYRLIGSTQTQDFWLV